MKKYFIIVFVLSFVLNLQAQNYKETKINLPSGAIGDFVEVYGSSKVVLMLHGFGSSRDEVGNMYKDLSYSLAKKGISSLRIDFRGWGETTYPMTSSSVTVMIEDATEALSFIKSKGFNKIGVQGFSLGGGLAQEFSVINKNDVTAISLWSSVIEFKYDNEKDIAEAVKKGKVDIDLGFRKITLGKTYFEELEKYNFFDNFINLQKPLLVQYGDKDYLFENAKVFEYNKYKDMQIVIHKNGDHIFLVLSDDQKISKSVIDNTVKFFEKELK